MNYGMVKLVLIGHNQSSGLPLLSRQQHKSNFSLAFTAKNILVFNGLLI